MGLAVTCFAGGLLKSQENWLPNDRGSFNIRDRTGTYNIWIPITGNSICEPCMVICVRPKIVSSQSLQNYSMPSPTYCQRIVEWGSDSHIATWGLEHWSYSVLSTTSRFLNNLISDRAMVNSYYELAAPINSLNESSLLIGIFRINNELCFDCTNKEIALSHYGFS